MVSPGRIESAADGSVRLLDKMIRRSSCGSRLWSVSASNKTGSRHKANPPPSGSARRKGDAVTLQARPRIGSVPRLKASESRHGWCARRTALPLPRSMPGQRGAARDFRMISVEQRVPSGTCLKRRKSSTESKNSRTAAEQLTRRACGEVIKGFIGDCPPSGAQVLGDFQHADQWSASVDSQCRTFADDGVGNRLAKLFATLLHFPTRGC